MTETSKMPFEPIPMPGMPEMPKPSFSRSTTPPQSAPPITRKPLMIAEDKPDSFFLPNGIAPEAPKSPPTMTAEVKPSGFPLNWLKPSRAKGVVIAGLGSLGIGAFGINAFVPVPTSEPMTANTFADTTSLQPTKLQPRVDEEREDKLPGLLPPPAPIGGDNLLDKPLPLPGELTQVSAAVPEVKAVPVPPTGLPALPTGLPLVPITQTDPLPVPLIPGLGSEPKPLGAAPIMTPPALPGLPAPTLGEAKNKPLPLPTLGTEPATNPILPSALPPIELAPTTTTIAPPTPLLPLTEPTPVTLPVTPKLNPEPKLLTPGSYSPIPVPIELVKPATKAPTEAKTDYDVDIHKIRAGDTYATISQRYYETANFANQLRTYNENADLSRTPDVQVPPMYVIKKFGTGRGADSTGVVPAGVMQNPTPLAPSSTPDVEWGTPSARKSGTSGKSNNGEPLWR
jgi:LysM repeat protein